MLADSINYARDFPAPGATTKNSRYRNEKPLSHMKGRGAGVRAGVARLRADQFADLLFDLVHLGESVSSALGKDLLPVEKNFERSRFAGGHRHRPQVIVVVVQQVLRQTGGSSQIPSGGAVLDTYSWLLLGRGLALDALVGHVVTSVRRRSLREWSVTAVRTTPMASVAWPGRQYDLLSSRTLHTACPVTQEGARIRSVETMDVAFPRAGSRATDGTPPTSALHAQPAWSRGLTSGAHRRAEQGVRVSR